MQDNVGDGGEIRQGVLDFLAEYVSAPALREAKDDVRLRDCGLDSFGTFEFLLALEKRMGIDLSEQHLDARRCRSVDGIVDVLAEIRTSDAD